MLNILLSCTYVLFKYTESVRSWCDGSSDLCLVVDPFSYFSFSPVSTTGVTKAVDGHIKERLLLIGVADVAIAGFLSCRVVLYHISDAI